MQRRPRLAVPYHVARLPGGRLVGLDAYFWPSLERRYRVVLLVHPAERLAREPPPGSCRLPSRVAPQRQASEIEAVASLKPRPPRLPRLPRPSLAERLASLLVPGRLLARGGEPAEALPSEELQARGLAKLLKGLEPTGETRWAAFTSDNAGAALLLPEDPSLARIYQALADRDPGYTAAAREAIRSCSR
ncbi:MAG: hypothetical protein GXO15_01315 [Crenarchaeota archaeon]|nr:hypothetical protein [Thermoproteota archaeon]